MARLPGVFLQDGQVAGTVRLFNSDNEKDGQAIEVILVKMTLLTKSCTEVWA
jgi:hypothetical protein